MSNSFETAMGSGPVPGVEPAAQAKMDDAFARWGEETAQNGNFMHTGTEQQHMGVDLTSFGYRSDRQHRVVLDPRRAPMEQSTSESDRHESAVRGSGSMAVAGSGTTLEERMETVARPEPPRWGVERSMEWRY